MSSGYLAESLEQTAALVPLVGEMGPVVDQVASVLTGAWDAGNKVMFAGNGGSAADAMHFAEELVVRYRRDRRALAALAFLDPTTITCAGNDMGYDHVFSRQIEALGRPGDVFVGLTTSGNSTNVANAFAAAKKLGITTVGFLGKDGGRCRAICDVPLIVPSPVTARVQEMHKLIFHSLCEYVDAWALGEV
ncbi:MAG TPA: SIS domain-containing protein [Tepidisphaeraceae bacterium]|jgi:D-sedoheptulose 7-phosphate isomerase